MAAAVTLLLRWLGIILYRLGLARPLIWLRRQSPRVLLYHACEDEASDFTRGLNSSTTPRDFAAQLAFLRRYYTVVPLSQLESGRCPDRSVVITFDDGYRSVGERALPLLRAEGFPATVYLVTDVVGNEALVWVNELNWFLNAHANLAFPRVRQWLGAAADEDAAALVGRARAAYDPEGTRRCLAELRAAAGVDPARLARDTRLYVDWEEVAAMARDGISFGNHTASHPSLARLTPDAQRDEITRARDELVVRLGACTSLAYPFGDHDDASRDAAIALGHRSIMEVGGTNAPLDPRRIARVPVYARNDAEFFAELEVITPGRALLKRLLTPRRLS